jgi:hypothetical protein
MGDNTNINNKNYKKEHKDQTNNQILKHLCRRSTAVLIFSNTHLLLPPSVEQKLNLRTIIQTCMMSLSDHINLPCKSPASLLIRGMNPYEISRLGWLIRFVKHTIWADSLYFLYLLLFSTSKILASSKPTL